VLKIAESDFSELDIKPLSGCGNMYRCGVGKVRIIFEKLDGENIVHDIGFRGGIYNR